MALRAVPEARWWWRLWSVRVAAVGALFSVGSTIFPGLLNIISPLDHPRTYWMISTGFFLVTLAARLVAQPDTHPDA